MTPALTATTSYYLVVTGTNIPAPTPADAKQITVGVLAVPIAPVATVIQPTCSIPTGTIIVTAPMAPGNTYSLDGLQSGFYFLQLESGSTKEIRKVIVN